MSYIAPFEVVKKKIKLSGHNGAGRVDMRYAEFIDVLKLLLRAVPVDEQWYLAHYPDVATAVLSGTYKSGKHHFVEEGYFEGRTPCEFSVDEEWYSKTYADVASGLATGMIESARDHFLSHGYREGRLPAEY
jgi:hypothetical protein